MPIPSIIQENVELAPYTTMGVSAKAKFFAGFRSLEELKSLIEYAERSGLKLLILGGGSNVLFLSDFDGLVIRNEVEGFEIVSETADHIHLKLGAGENWHETVTRCVEKGWGGIENLALIPGTVGAAPIQNIGAYGVELKDVFVRLEGFDMLEMNLRTLSFDECNFGYRESVLKHELKGRLIITSVTLRLAKDPIPNLSYKPVSTMMQDRNIADPEIKDVYEAVIDIRNSKLPDPKELGNTGSFFKNPVITKVQFEQLQASYPDIPGYLVDEHTIKVPAGWLIDQAGWKGYREGDAGDHEKQALVLVNYGNATGIQIRSLAEKIIQSIRSKFDILLTPEVNIIP